MLFRIAAELAATGAEVIFWFHGLSEGKSDWPSKLGRLRSSRASIATVRRKTLRDWRVLLRRSCWLYAARIGECPKTRGGRRTASLPAGAAVTRRKCRH